MAFIYSKTLRELYHSQVTACDFIYGPLLTAAETAGDTARVALLKDIQGKAFEAIAAAFAYLNVPQIDPETNPDTQDLDPVEIIRETNPRLI